MTKIFIKPQEPAPKIGVGTWLKVKIGTDCYRGVIAQIDSGLIVFVAITEKEANRLTSKPVEWNSKGGLYEDLHDDTVSAILPKGATYEAIDAEVVYSK